MTTAPDPGQDLLAGGGHLGVGGEGAVALRGAVDEGVDRLLGRPPTAVNR